MAEGHAKLSLRHEVSVYDALAAIKLYEENMTLHSGYSLLIQNEGSTENDEVVSTFFSWIQFHEKFRENDFMKKIPNVDPVVADTW